MTAPGYGIFSADSPDFIESAVVVPFFKEIIQSLDHCRWKALQRLPEIGSAIPCFAVLFQAAVVNFAAVCISCCFPFIGEGRIPLGPFGAAFLILLQHHRPAVHGGIGKTHGCIFIKIVCLKPQGAAISKIIKAIHPCIAANAVGRYIKAVVMNASGKAVPPERKGPDSGHPAAYRQVERAFPLCIFMKIESIFSLPQTESGAAFTASRFLRPDIDHTAHGGGAV